VFVEDLFIFVLVLKSLEILACYIFLEVCFIEDEFALFCEKLEWFAVDYFG